jgi:CRISPR-associated protein Csx14
MTKDNVLIISLGFSPAVVPETLDALLEKGIYIKRTYIVTTGNNTILNECIPLIQKDFQEHYFTKNMELHPFQAVLSNEDIYSEKDNLDLMMKVSTIFKKEKGNNIYISMAGGRKTMSAAMALLAQIFSARAITHVLVPKKVENIGNISRLRELNQAEKEKVLHPDPKETRLIFFPVIGISWMLDDMINILQGLPTRQSNKGVREILKENNLIDEENHPTPLGKQLLELLDDINKLPEPSFVEPDLKFKKDETPHAPKGYQKFVMKLAQIPFVEKIIGVRFKNTPRTRILNINSDGTIYCEYSDGTKSYEMKVLTTAKTRGETSVIEKYMKSILELS